MFEFKFADATEAQKWEQIRLWRNAELAASDWTQTYDARTDRQAWADYRQALRDLPQTFDKPEKVIVPVAPKA